VVAELGLLGEELRQQITGALGLAVLATIANSRTDDLVASSGGAPSDHTNALNEGFQSAFLGGASA
jgi:hypothetical protein